MTSHLALAISALAIGLLAGYLLAIELEPAVSAPVTSDDSQESRALRARITSLESELAQARRRAASRNGPRARNSKVDPLATRPHPQPQAPTALPRATQRKRARDRHERLAQHAEPGSTTTVETPLEFPADLPDRLRPPAVEDAFEAAIEELGSGSLVGLDCDQYPCIAVGRLSSARQLKALKATRALAGFADDRLYADWRRPDKRGGEVEFAVVVAERTDGTPTSKKDLAARVRTRINDILGPKKGGRRARRRAASKSPRTRRARNRRHRDGTRDF